MQVGEIIQRIQALYSKGVNSVDTRLSSRHIYNKILSVRARLISQEYKKKQRVSQWNYQSIACMELIKVPSHDCPCVPPMGCDILRTKYPLPEPISGLHEDLIQMVSSIDRQIKMDRVTLNAVRSLRGNKYSSNKVSFFIHNKYLYLTTSTKIRYISVVGLFEDPMKVREIANFCDNCIDCVDCIDYESEEFPIDTDMIDALIELCANELIVMFLQAKEDKRSNSKDDIVNE